MKILLIEPDEYYHRQFSEHLGGHFDVITARDANAAESLLVSAEPDLVVSELLLSDGPSFALLEKMRSARKSSAMPIVIFSQIATLPDMEQVLGLGVSGYFVKGKDSISDVKKLLLSLNN